MSYTTKRFLQETNECLNTKDVERLRKAFSDYQFCNCYNPIKLRVYDSHTQTINKRWLPCGKCYHCLETKINSWVTRMYAHLEDFKHVYFITLTYRSITTIRDVESLMLKKLSQAVWLLDDNNFNNHKSYNPCLLVKSHYQNFIKRLRKNTGYNDITYVLCGEYGSIFGRPHFHLVLFSNNDITKEDVVKAWSIALWRSDSGTWSFRNNQKYNGTPYNFPIGHVDFNDLVTNGTLNTTAKVRVDGSYLNASNCFSYVCKYVCKKDSYNDYRLKLAYNNLFRPEILCNSFQGVEPLHVALTEYQFLSIYCQTLIQNSYEEFIFSPTDKIVGYVHPNFQKSYIGKISTFEFYPSVFKDFRDSFAPFVEFSRGTPIGSIYAKNHIQEFVDGVFNKPLLQVSSFVVPNYFRIKAQNYVFGLRRLRTTIRGRSYYKGGLLGLYRLFEINLTDPTSIPYRVSPCDLDKDYKSLLCNDFYVYRDAYSGHKTLISGDCAFSYVYNRHTRNYEITESIPIANWLEIQLSKLREDFRIYRKVKKIQDISLKEKEKALFNCAKLGLTYKKLNKHFVDEQNNYLKIQQSNYAQIHVDVQ